MTKPDASQVARIAATRTGAVSGVVRLDAGPLGTKSTYGRGGKIDGVTVKAGAVPVGITVHVAVRFGRRIPELAAAITDEVRAGLHDDLPDDGPWDISVDVVDVVTEADELETPGGPPDLADGTGGRAIDRDRSDAAADGPRRKLL